MTYTYNLYYASLQIYVDNLLFCVVFFFFFFFLDVQKLSVMIYIIKLKRHNHLTLEEM